MNFAKTPNEVQLWSVIPYAVAAVLTGRYSSSQLYIIYVYVLIHLILSSLCRIHLRPPQTPWCHHAFLPPHRYNRIRRHR